MKKNIIIIILLVITSLSMFYAYIKANEAAIAAKTASMNQQEAVALKAEAAAMQVAAEEAAAEAKRQEALALEAIENCRNK